MNRDNFRVIFFDLGDTLIRQQVDSIIPLNQMNLELLPNVKDILRYTSQYCELGLITNTEQSTELIVRDGLQRLGISDFFKSITTSIDVGVKKPDEKVFLIALSKHQFQPSEAIMVGNNYKEDIIPAKRLGLMSIFIRPKDKSCIGQDVNFADADYIVEDTRGLLRLFHTLGGSLGCNL